MRIGHNFMRIFLGNKIFFNMSRVYDNPSMQKSLVNFHSGIEINLFRDVSRGSKKFDDWRMKQEGWKALTRIGVLTRTSEEA